MDKQIISDVRDYIALLKPRVMFLVIFTAFVGFYMAPGHIHPVLGLTALICISLGAGAAGGLNMWYERDLDALMTRTAKRPLPDKRMAPDNALGFSIILAVLSVSLLGLAVSYKAAFFLAFTIFFYFVIYTILLKKNTPQNIVIGGAAGALPPLVGWVSVTQTVTIEPLILFLIIFMWTPPHFWALALYKNADYQKANLPMLPVVKGKKITKIYILIYTLLLAPLTLTPYFIGMSSWVYAVSTAPLSFIFIGYAIGLFKNEKIAPSMFKFSIFYLFWVFLIMMLDHVIIFSVS